MKTAIAISPMMRNVLNVATIPPAAVKASHMARIAPRIVPMIRPMSPVCTQCLWQVAVVSAAPVRGRGLAGRLAGLAGTAPGHRWSQPSRRRQMQCGGMRERGLTDLPGAAGAWRRDGCVVLPGCLDGPALEAARRDLATVYPSAGEYRNFNLTDPSS